MLGRTKKSTIQFAREFSFTGSSGILPPGMYSIQEDEELIEGISWLAYRRTATFIEVPAIGTIASTVQIFKIDPDELSAILEHDAAFTDKEMDSVPSIAGSGD